MYTVYGERLASIFIVNFQKRKLGHLMHFFLDML